jgi:hypothetical protein
MPRNKYNEANGAIASVKHKTTWAVIKPNFGMLLESFIFPQLCFSDEDVQLWDEDPIEYIQRKMQGNLALSISFHMAFNFSEYPLR